jgi:hypothetical protein
MPRLKKLARGFMASVVAVTGLAATSMISFTGLVTAGSVAAGSVACADETFKCCECAFDCTDAATTMPATYYLCDCPKGDTYTYEECGIFCQQQLTQEELDARALMNNPPLSACTRLPKQGSVLAKNSCSPGWPVGEPP